MTAKLLRLMWGTISDDDGHVHVIPCDESGYIMPQHIISVECNCHPYIVDMKIVVHEVIQ